VLSITTKAKARKDRKEGKINTEPDSATPKKNEVEGSEKKDVEMADGEAKKDKEEEKKVEEEPEFQELRNPTRVVK
jgi:hypothetical protein